MALVHNIARLKPRRRELRRQLTIAEARLWNHLKGRALRGRKFRRQHSVGPYVLDFYCPAERLAVELDGAAHDHEAAQHRDAIRTLFLQGAGIRVVRFENREVIENLEGVLAVIARQFAIA
ncbi:MAG: endonuclease domain-containing protein [Burkholderiales bacterium]